MVKVNETSLNTNLQLFYWKFHFRLLFPRFHDLETKLGIFSNIAELSIFISFILNPNHRITLVQWQLLFRNSRTIRYWISRRIDWDPLSICFVRGPFNSLITFARSRLIFSVILECFSVDSASLKWELYWMAFQKLFLLLFYRRWSRYYLNKLYKS